LTPEEVARLDADLTPIGAERAGNEEGTIPAWTGEGLPVPASYIPGGHHPDPFPDDQPLFEITAANVDQYADKLTEGQLGLFKLYPETYRMKVYQTRRTAKNPDWVYQRTRECALTADVGEDGNTVSGARACLPFPIPKRAEEVIWNHKLRYGPPYIVGRFDTAAPDAKGRYILSKIAIDIYRPYFDLQREPDDYLSMVIPRELAPPRVAGDTTLVRDFVNPSINPRQAWRYFAGQRRVRRAPVFAFDTPLPASQGLRTVDTANMFNGSLERYNWELKGKREIYIPYNNYRLAAAGVKNDEIIRPGHINPELPRYELHRVWVVEATLKEGFRHIYPRRVMYLDEDSWAIHIHDMYDEYGQLWRAAHAFTKYAWNSEGIAPSTEVHHDLISRRYSAGPLMGEYPGPLDVSQDPPGDQYFTPSNIRKLGIR
jgi:hypothetical protein